MFTIIKNFFISIKASAAIEAAIILPVFFSFTFGIIEISRVLWVQFTLDTAAAEAARYGIINTSSTVAQIQNVAIADAPGIKLTTAMVSVTIASRTDITVDISYTFNFIAIPITSKVLRASSNYVV